MRILHILDHSLPLHSGYSFRTAAILREQRALKWKTFHLTGSKQGYRPCSEEDIDGWHFFRTPQQSWISSRLPVFRHMGVIGGLSRRLEEVARKVGADVLHAHSPSLNAIPALQVGRRLGIPVVYEVRALWEDAAVDHGTSREWGVRYRLSRALETYALRNADAIVTICEGLKGDIRRRGIPDSKITVVPNAVNVDQFKLGQLPDPSLIKQFDLQGKLVLGFIGSFYAYEGLDILLQALPRILRRQPETRILLVGGGPCEMGLKALAARLRIDDKVIFTGRVPHEQVAHYYDLVNVLVYPRVKMRLTDLVTPLKPLEAMAQGRLVIASDVGGHLELIRDGENGVLFKAGCPIALAESVLRLQGSPDLWSALRMGARSFVEKERNWQLSVSRYKAVYGALSGKKVVQ